MGTRLGQVLGFCWLLAQIAWPVAAQQDPLATSLAQQAYERIMASSFSASEMVNAEHELQRAEAMDDQNSWVALTRSELALKQGYISGNGFRAASYQPQALITALQYANTAVGIAPAASPALCQLAKVLIISGEINQSLPVLVRALEADAATFSPWYLQAVLAVKRRATDRFPAIYAEAEKYANQPYQKSALLWERIYYSRLVKDLATEESAYQQMIRLDPDSAHAHGNYGSFLLRQHRVAEAIKVLEYAVSLEAYPLAVTLLDKARAVQP